MSEIAFWCTFDEKISKTFQYFKVWIKSGLKVTFSTFSNSNFKISAKVRVYDSGQNLKMTKTS